MDCKTPPFSQNFRDSLLKTAMIDEMARADDWQGLDECLEFKPELIKKLARYADAALRAIKRIDAGDCPTLLTPH